MTTTATYLMLMMNDLTTASVLYIYYFWILSRFNGRDSSGSTTISSTYVMLFFNSDDLLHFPQTRTLSNILTQ
jgi:hypothetical protein